MQWWFCLIHLLVEPEAGCPNDSRLGPYDSAELAQGALARMKSREEQVTKDDPE